MALVYYRKVFPHDLTHEVSFTQKVHSLFFNGRYTFSFTLNGGPTKYQVLAFDTTDLRFGGAFKSLLPLGLQVNDLIRIEKKEECYDISFIRAASSLHSKYFGLLGVNQRHLIMNGNNVVYKR